MGVDWTLMITRAGEFFPVLAGPAAILFGLGLTFLILDFIGGMVMGSRGGVGGSSSGDTPPRMSPMRRIGNIRNNRGRPPTWRDEPYYRSDSWQELEDRANTVNRKGGD